MLKTSNAHVGFGRWKGELLTRVPPGYLRWAVNQGIEAPQALPDSRPVPAVVPFYEAATLELDRRGERVQDVEISAHAIDRISQLARGMEAFTEHRLPASSREEPHEGLFSFLERTVETLVRTDAELQYAAQEALHTENPVEVVVSYLGLRWVIQVNLAIPVLLTVKPGA